MFSERVAAQLRHALGVRADFRFRVGRPVHLFAEDVFLQPELAVVAQLVGVVMAAGLMGERPRHARLEHLECLLAALVPLSLIHI